MNPEHHVRLSRRLTVLYPDRFRREYRDDLVGLFNRQMSEMGAPSCWARVLCDLALSVPLQHLEARMHRPSTSPSATLCVGIAAISMLLAVIVGASAAGLALLLVALGAMAVGVGVWRASRPVAAPAVPRRWRRLLGAGLLVLAGVIVFVNVGPAADGIDTDGVWFMMMFTLFTSVVLIVAGAIGGIARLFHPGTRPH